MRKLILAIFVCTVAAVTALTALPASAQLEETLEENGATGLQGRITAAPPQRGATITVPTNGQTFTSLPVTVRGLCPGNLLVKLFSNGVFVGSTQCNNGNFSLIIDLFNGRNELVAIVYDDLNQAGPESNRVTVTYRDNRQGAASRPSLTSNYAKRGANPGDELTWPIIVSGGAPPYAISVDWGDGTEPDLIIVENPGPFTIKHTYESPGIYNIIVKATDRNEQTAYLQLVGIGNGPLEQGTGEGEDGGAGQTQITRIILWQPAAFLLPLLVLAFWFGRRNQMKELRNKIARGERPF